MDDASRLVRHVQIATLAGIAICVVAGEMFARTWARDSANALFHALSFISISLVGATLLVRRTLVVPSEEALRQRSDDSLAVARWRAGYLSLYSMSGTLGVFGLVLRLASFPLGHVWGFYLGGILLLLVYSPRSAQLEFM